ncbi:MAG: dermonecrotic toxin domain-containing protein, partial [Pseudomonas sp.]
MAAQKILHLLVEHYPIFATVQPPLTDAEPFRLAVPDDISYQPRQPLVQVVLQALLDGKALDLGRAHDREPALTWAEPYLLPGSDGHDYLEFKGMTDAINELVQELPYHFQQAQVEYWQAESGSGVSRDIWLQQTLKTAMLRNLPLQGLDSQQQACVHGLLNGRSGGGTVFTVEVQLEADGERVQRMLPNLLLTGEWDERTVVLWCAPSSVVKCFDSLDHFALALKDELAAQYRFGSMSWNRYELEGDVFSQQAALLLDAMLDSVQSLRYSQLTDIAKMEQAYAALCDPSQWFIEGYAYVSDASVGLPPGVLRASASDSFAYQCALFELALAESESKGVAALEGVLDLHSFASQRLRTQLLADHPVDANYFPDDLNLTLTVARG